MLKNSMIVAAALVVMASSASADTLSNAAKLNTNIHPVPVISLTCFNSGPVEFPEDIVITNSGVFAVSAGTLTHWSAGPFNGDYMFTSPLAPSASVKLTGVTRGAQGRLPCTVVVKKPPVVK